MFQRQNSTSKRFVPSAEACRRIPRELRSLRRWVTWRYFRESDGSLKKRPDQRVNSPDQWLFFDASIAHAERCIADGIGIVLGDGLVGIDLDGCIDAGGDLREDARELLALRTYVEVSPSRKGLHGFVFARILRSRKVKNREIYDGLGNGHGRFFTVTCECIGSATSIATGAEVQADLDRFVAKWFTGDNTPMLAPTPQAANADDDTILGLLLAQRGGKAARLFAGDWSDYPSQSEADLSLCRRIAYYSLNPEQVDRIFRSSGLMRAKWDERRGQRTYGARTVAKAIASACSGRLHYLARAPSRARTSAHARRHERTSTQVLDTGVSLETILAAREKTSKYGNGSGEANPFLRDDRWLPTALVCDFLLGHSGENCKRCGASWQEHYPATVEDA